MDSPVRLETVVYRRDRVYVATAPTLFVGILIALLWPLVLAVCWGWFDAPWLSLVPGLAGTAALIRWGARIGRGSLAAARGPVPHLIVTADELRVWQSSPAGVARIPMAAIRVVAIDQPSARQRRADRVRFPVGSGPVGWLYCPDESALPTITYGFGRTPNLAVLFTRPMPIGSGEPPVHGFLAAVADPHAASAAFTGRVPVRTIEPADLDGASLPVLRLGRDGLREVRSEDRIRARLVDGFAILVIFLLLAARLAPPGRNQVPGVTAALVLGWFLYEVPSTALTGRTFGKLLLGLRVVRAEDGGARLGLGRATARWLLRILNGLIGSPAGHLVGGDPLGRIAPRLSLIDGVGAGTIVVAEGDFRRLRSEPSARQRERALNQTLIEIEALEPTVSGRAAWTSLLFVVVLVAGVAIPAMRYAVSDEPRRPGVPEPAVSRTTVPPLLVPTPITPAWPTLPAPSFPIPVPSLDPDIFPD